MSDSDAPDQQVPSSDPTGLANLELAKYGLSVRPPKSGVKLPQPTTLDIAATRAANMIPVATAQERTQRFDQRSQGLREGNVDKFGVALPTAQQSVEMLTGPIQSILGGDVAGGLTEMGFTAAQQAAMMAGGNRLSKGAAGEAAASEAAAGKTAAKPDIASGLITRAVPGETSSQFWSRVNGNVANYEKAAADRKVQLTKNVIGVRREIGLDSEAGVKATPDPETLNIGQSTKNQLLTVPDDHWGQTRDLPSLPKVPVNEDGTVSLYRGGTKLGVEGRGGLSTDPRYARNYGDVHEYRVPLDWLKKQQLDRGWVNLNNATMDEIHLTPEQIAEASQFYKEPTPKAAGAGAASALGAKPGPGAASPDDPNFQIKKPYSYTPTIYDYAHQPLGGEPTGPANVYDGTTQFALGTKAADRAKALLARIDETGNNQIYGQINQLLKPDQHLNIDWRMVQARLDKGGQGLINQIGTRNFNEISDIAGQGVAHQFDIHGARAHIFGDIRGLQATDPAFDAFNRADSEWGWGKMNPERERIGMDERTTPDEQAQMTQAERHEVKTRNEGILARKAIRDQFPGQERQHSGAVELDGDQTPTSEELYNAKQRLAHDMKMVEKIRGRDLSRKGDAQLAKYGTPTDAEVAKARDQLGIDMKGVEHVYKTDLLEPEAGIRRDYIADPENAQVNRAADYYLKSIGKDQPAEPTVPSPASPAKARDLKGLNKVEDAIRGQQGMTPDEITNAITKLRNHVGIFDNGYEPAAEPITRLKAGEQLSKSETEKLVDDAAKAFTRTGDLKSLNKVEDAIRTQRGLTPDEITDAITKLRKHVGLFGKGYEAKPDFPDAEYVKQGSSGEVSGWEKGVRDSLSKRKAPRRPEPPSKPKPPKYYREF